MRRNKSDSKHQTLHFSVKHWLLRIDHSRALYSSIEHLVICWSTVSPITVYSVMGNLVEFNICDFKRYDRFGQVPSLCSSKLNRVTICIIQPTAIYTLLAGSGKILQLDLTKVIILPLRLSVYITLLSSSIHQTLGVICLPFLPTS